MEQESLEPAEEQDSACIAPARWWHKSRGRVACDLCPRGCKLNEGQRGFCYVRRNIGGEMKLTTFGKSTGFCIDPIEKKPLNHFLPGTATFSFGTAGCNLGCAFCQNWETSKAKETAERSSLASPEQIAHAALVTGCRSVAVTYNDPIVWMEYAIETAQAAHALGLKTVAVSAGHIKPKPRAELFAHIDAVNVDLKAYSEDFYRKLSGVSLAPILDTLRWLRHESDTWLELTNLVIPGENDGDDAIKALCDWVVENLGPQVPLHFTAFHPDHQMRDVPPTPPERLVSAREIAMLAGLRFVYVGNVLDVEHQSTYCPECKALLIERDHYALGRFNVKEGACGECGAAIPGCFEPVRGSWGRKRVPIDVSSLAALMAEEPPAEQSAQAVEAVEAGAAEAAEAVQQLADEPDEAPPAVFAGRPLPRRSFRCAFHERDLECLAVSAAELAAAAIGRFPAKLRLTRALAEVPAYGIFITLRRGGQLRGCIGHWGDAAAENIGALLTSASVSAAVNDVRFPGISPAELPFLATEVSLMHKPAVMQATGRDRIAAVEVGRHGLVIAHPTGRGLLLPNVAAQHGWDAETFLKEVCRKAGLPPETWLQPEAELLTFETVIAVREAAQTELEPHRLPPQLYQQLAALGNIALMGERRQVPIDPLLSQPWPGLLGLFLEDHAGVNAADFAPNAALTTLLQNTAVKLARSRAQQGRVPAPIRRLALLSHPITLHPLDYPARCGTLASCAVWAQSRGRGAVIIPAPQVPPDKVGAALNALGCSPEDWRAGQAAVTAFTVLPLELPAPTRPEAAPKLIRPPAVAGTFYPGDPQGVLTELKRLFGTPTPIGARTPRAVLLPHAGWQYSGDITARVLSQVHVPNGVILIGPRHIREGARWAIAPHDAWQFPHCRVPLMKDLARQLAQALPALTLDPAAHAKEYNLEALVPLLHHVNPQVRILPILLGPSRFEELEPLAALLARILAQGPRAPLVVISSDMNHFAAEEQNRKLDRMALEALFSGDPARLHQTCAGNQISMCGLQPATALLRALALTRVPPRFELVGYATSTRVTNNPDRVVGYAGVIIE